MFRTRDLEPVDDRQPGIRYRAYDGVHQLPDETKIFETLAEAHVNVEGDCSPLSNVRKINT
jgi:hypothetical protein